MIQWLHRYIFRGTGLLFAVGMLTFLWLMINQFVHMQSGKTPASQSKGERR